MNSFFKPIVRLRKTLFSKQTLKEFFVGFLASYGVLGGTAQVIEVFWPNTLSFGTYGLLTLLFLSLASALVVARPKYEFSRYFSVPDTKVVVKVGDIFEEDTNLVIGFNDVFDTELGEVISVNSLQGQFLEKIYNSNRGQLDREIEVALQGQMGVVDASKAKGKNTRYGVGTVAVLSQGNRQFFCSAYSQMGADLVAASDINAMWESLDKLWNEIRQKGECKTISLPVVGTELARVSGISHTAIIKLMLLSFAINSRSKIITKELRLIIHPSHLAKINLKEIEIFLSGI